MMAIILIALTLNIIATQCEPDDDVITCLFGEQEDDGIATREFKHYKDRK